MITTTVKSREAEIQGDVALLSSVRAILQSALGYISKLFLFLLIGPPRSGTTLLRRILDAHPRIASPPETYLLSAAARFLHEERFAHGLRIGVLSGLAFAGFDEAEVLARLRALVLGFLDDHARARGKPRWADR